MTRAEPAPYPSELEHDVVLLDGTTVRVRPIRADDTGAHRDFVERLSEEAVYFRFFTPRRRLTDGETRHFVEVDYIDRLALVALDDDQIIAVARFDRLSNGHDAEVAFVVEDRFQGRGLGTLLLEHLAAAATERGIARFVADVLPENRRMLEVFHRAGYETVDRFTEGVIRVALALEPSAQTLDLIEQREHRAEAASIRRLLEPRSVAVVGASRDPGHVGHHLFLNLLRANFDGPVHPVNPAASYVASVQASPSVLDVPGPVDLAVIAVPAAAVEGVVEQCAEKGVKGLVVISAGFAETGDAGAAMQQRVLQAARRGGMRMVGPNCIGVVNTAVGLDATFAPQLPVPGRVSFLSQSGALGIAVLDWSYRMGLGISSFVSIGNKADVSGNDVLQYWEDDPATEVILLYLESFGNPRKFSRVARRVSRRKPIVAVKSGRTAAGTRAASSHTAASASSDVAVDALFRQTGVIRVDTLEHLLDVGQVLASQPLPAGRRLAIVGNSGGPGILAADAAVAAGLRIAELGDETVDRLRRLLGPAAAVTNPVDMVASAEAGAYVEAVRLVLADPGVDLLLVIYTPPLVTDAADIAAAIVEASDGATKPIAVNFVAAVDAASLFDSPPPDGRRLPLFQTPERAAMALGKVSDYAKWRRRDPGRVPDLEGVDVAGARALIEERLAGDGEGWLDAEVVYDLLGRLGVAVADWRRVDDPDAAAVAADALGLPVAVKAASGSVVHKSDVGAVRLGLRSAAEVRAAAGALAERFGPVLVQEMVHGGVETIVGVVQDPLFGPLIMFGMGGVATELLGDRSYRVVPVTDNDAAELVRSLRASPLLFGYRGTAPAAVGALEELLVRISVLAEACPEIAELDLNPVIVSPDGAAVVDARARVARPVGEVVEGVRRLD